jgi:hypothetical protein
MLAGCGPKSGFLRDANAPSEHQFRTEIAAQRYSRSVSGASSVGALFCVLPMRNGAYKDAMAALHAEAKLQTNEVLENIREDHAFSAYVLYCEDNLILSADVYEVIPVGAPAPVRSAKCGDCDPPYSIDSQGRQIFKPECVSASEQFEPSDPYIRPSRSYVPPATWGGDAGAEARDPGF